MKLMISSDHFLKTVRSLKIIYQFKTKMDVSSRDLLAILLRTRMLYNGQSMQHAELRTNKSVKPTRKLQNYQLKAIYFPLAQRLLELKRLKNQNQNRMKLQRYINCLYIIYSLVLQWHNVWNGGCTLVFDAS